MADGIDKNKIQTARQLLAHNTTPRPQKKRINQNMPNIFRAETCGQANYNLTIRYSRYLLCANKA
jgi:hypothetical protein